MPNDPREFDTDTIMLQHYADMEYEVSDRKAVALDLKHEQQLTELLKLEIHTLKQYVHRVENERDYYQSASAFQGP
jgi:hypothetical protein